MQVKGRVDTPHLAIADSRIRVADIGMRIEQTLYTKCDELTTSHRPEESNVQGGEDGFIPICTMQLTELSVQLAGTLQLSVTSCKCFQSKPRTTRTIFQVIDTPRTECGGVETFHTKRSRKSCTSSSSGIAVYAHLQPESMNLSSNAADSIGEL